MVVFEWKKRAGIDPRPRNLSLSNRIISHTLDAGLLTARTARQLLITAVLPQPAAIAGADVTEPATLSGLGPFATPRTRLPSAIRALRTDGSMYRGRGDVPRALGGVAGAGGGRARIHRARAALLCTGSLGSFALGWSGEGSAGVWLLLRQHKLVFRRWRFALERRTLARGITWIERQCHPTYPR